MRAYATHMPRDSSRPLTDSFSSRLTDGREVSDDAIDGQGNPFNRNGGVCDQNTLVGAVSELPSHAAALGLRFYNETNFPSRYHGSCFIAEHGSWNRE